MKLPPATLQILNASTRWRLASMTHPRPVPPGWHVEMDDTGAVVYAWQRPASETEGKLIGLLLRFEQNLPNGRGALLPRNATPLDWRPIMLAEGGQWRAFERSVRHGWWVKKSRGY